eukprot:CAMPEP_0195305786 /NCGR_PEP_ID=MMETSP0707-20130614/36866_1 /TAXON_ID=33640 /ORGANISM="Asterionellopsis glacialis, Strain CCMP134" /LENGTH=815 /DNA_ID=CAMNT_0040369987 /DNA_START=100 /DNA_END=2544 /DNA_ORIENTATION=+
MIPKSFVLEACIIFALVATRVHSSMLGEFLPDSELSSTTTISRTSFMSGKHGIGYRLPGGVGYGTAYYNATNFANQIKDLPISYVVMGLSSGAFGDRYLANHSVLTGLNRASTPIKSPSNDGTFPADNFTIEDYEDRDVFDDFLTAMESINVSVIAYMAAQGPAMLKAGEIAAYDYNNKSPYVDSCALCPNLTGNEGCECAPSVWQWKNLVKTRYGNDTDATLHRAYAEIIVNEYAERYGSRIAGWWFDQGSYGNGSLVAEKIHSHNPNAAIAWNDGNKVPLRNNNPGIEDYTFGHITPLKNNANPSDGCYNYGMVLSAENSIDGYVYSDFDTYKNDLELTHNGASTYDYAVKSNPATRPDEFRYNTTGSPSLAHMYMPLNIRWNNGGIIWDKRQGAEWMKRVTDAGGAFTWAVARSGCGGCDQKFNSWNNALNQDEIHGPDLDFLVDLYSMVDSMDSSYSYQYDDTNCKCCTTSTSNSEYDWGCLEIEGYNDTCDATKGLETILNTYAPTPQPEVTNPPLPDCVASDDASDWSYTAPNGANKTCTGNYFTRFDRCDFVGNDDRTAYEACPFKCGCCATSNPENPNAYDECPNLASSPPTPSPTPPTTSPPTPSPTSLPTSSPTPSPTSMPTTSPTPPPTSSPTQPPTSSPTSSPTQPPTSSPTSLPTSSPTQPPTSSPTSLPTSSPTQPPTSSPTSLPTSSPTQPPTPSPTSSPTQPPTISPTPSPTPLSSPSPTSPPTPSTTPSPTVPPTPSPGSHPSQLKGENSNNRNDNGNSSSNNSSSNRSSNRSSNNQKNGKNRLRGLRLNRHSFFFGW